MSSKDETYAVGSLLPKLAEVILEEDEAEKAKVCDLRVMCGDKKVFHSFRVLLAAISPMLKSELLNPESDCISLPREFGYKSVHSLHQCLLLNNVSENELENSIDLMSLLGLSFSQTQKDVPKKSKIVLSCGECGKEYVSEACYANHMKLHEQEFLSLSRKKQEKIEEAITDDDSCNARPKRNSSKPKRFDDTEALQFIEEEIRDEFRKKRRVMGNWHCADCGRPFATKQTLENHEKLHMNDRKFPCDQCGKKFVSDSALKGHVKLHEDHHQFNCEHCDKKFNNANNLKRHVRSVHFEFSDKKLFPCPNCGKKFKDPSSLRAHEKIHNGERNVKCDFCPKLFFTKTQLKVHQRTHTGEKPFACSNCDRRFTTKDQLKSHTMHRHLGVKHEKNQLCPQCGVSFVTGYDLKIHMLRHSGETPYACDVCYKTFRAERNLKTHMKTHSSTDEKVPRCEQCGKTFKSHSSKKLHKNCQNSQVQTIMFVNRDGEEQYIQLEDGQVYSEGIYEIQEANGEETHVTFIDTN